jgi:4-amino-4-deoxy-L-arabinose transferase-like glycosyltransferase
MRGLSRLIRDRRVALVGIVIAAVVVRLAGLGDRLSIDEGYSWIVGSASTAHAFLDHLAGYENTPPLFYFLLTPLPLDDEVWLRLPALIAGVASVPVLYAIVRPLLGTALALLAALGLAVAPYHVQFSNYSRGFVLATFGLLLALWGAAHLAQGRGRRWWWLYAVGAGIAVYSEYDSFLFLAPLVAALLVLGVPRRRETLVFGAAVPVLLLLPWAGESSHSRDLAGVTKLDPSGSGLTAHTLRDQVATVFFGDQGLTAGPGARTVLYALVVAALFLSGVALRRRSRIGFWLIAGTGLGVLATHALTAATGGPDVLGARYMTALIPLAAAVLAAGVTALRWRMAVPFGVAALLGTGVFVFANRFDREVDPDYQRVAALVERAHPRAVLTNSAVLRYYIHHPRPVVDRPFGLRGRGNEPQCLRVCPRPYAVAEDIRSSKLRPGPGKSQRVEEISVRVVRRGD